MWSFGAVGVEGLWDLGLGFRGSGASGFRCFRV